MRAEAVIECTELVSAALQGAFDVLPKKRGEVFVLVYLSQSRTQDGRPVPGFRPGYIPSTWPAGNTSDHWVTARLSDDTTFDFLPLTDWGRGGRFVLDILDAKSHTFSIGRK